MRNGERPSVSESVLTRGSSSAQTRSAQRLAIFVKICMAVALMALARTGALWVPPAIEMWAPSRSNGADGKWAMGNGRA